MCVSFMEVSLIFFVHNASLLLTGVATMGPRGAMAPSLLSYFRIVSMSWFTFAIVSIFIIMLWPPHLFSARNAPAFTLCLWCRVDDILP